MTLKQIAAIILAIVVAIAFIVIAIIRPIMRGIEDIAPPQEYYYQENEINGEYEEAHVMQTMDFHFDRNGAKIHIIMC